MIIEVQKSKLYCPENGAGIYIPASKSHSIRAIILAAFASSPSKIENILLSDDTKTAFSVIMTLGAKTFFYAGKNNLPSVKIIPLTAEAKKELIRKKDLIINAGNSGSVFYFLGVILALVPLDFVLTGDTSLCSRPTEHLLSIYNQAGITYSFLEKKGFAPLAVHGKRVKKGTVFSLKGSFSQPVTGLLIAASLFLTGTEIRLEEAGERPYLQMTIDWLKTAGIPCRFSASFKRFYIKGGKNIASIQKTIPADWSSAAFPITAALVSNSSIKLKNIDINDVQGDKRIVEILQRMGAKIVCDAEEKTVTVRESLSNLKGGEFDCKDIPDAVPALSAAACFARGKTVLKNIAICRAKECDRISAVREELQKIGASITEGHDFLIIEGQGGKNLRCAKTCTHGDHRIGLMLCAAAMGISNQDCKNRGNTFIAKEACETLHSLNASEIHGAECFSVSYPGFIDDMRAINAKIRVLSL